MDLSKNLKNWKESRRLYLLIGNSKGAIFNNGSSDSIQPSSRMWDEVAIPFDPDELSSINHWGNTARAGAAEWIKNAISRVGVH